MEWDKEIPLGRLGRLGRRGKLGSLESFVELRDRMVIPYVSKKSSNIIGAVSIQTLRPRNSSTNPKNLSPR
jgi:superfamily II DNA/RNA helicase